MSCVHEVATQCAGRGGGGRDTGCLFQKRLWVGGVGVRDTVKAALCVYGSASSKRKKKSKYKHTLTHTQRRRPTAPCLVLRVLRVLQCVVVCCSVLQCVQCGTAVCCSVLQCVAVCCSVLQCVAVCSMCSLCH